ncbi:hypothetical protein POX_b02127 [Penicillium oxalicum]|uniref:hypothetical protein n=1 Tax=Penicillium oxalicum TaxID=69781 RepID=UPI0020B663FC|nr:hypothetical protein POX_b02127 [Penicillium oxalicum]KAI2792092.1 hypothetical protein POX_b02127 [Penicillium oxalicum]
MSNFQVQQAQPRHRRRPSISERIQRVLHGDRAEKVREHKFQYDRAPSQAHRLQQKRQSYSPGDDARGGLQADQSAQPATTALGETQTQSEKSPPRNQIETVPSAHTRTTGSLHENSYPSTQTFSSQTSHLPATSTPGSSPSVRAASVHPRDGQSSTPRHVSISEDHLQKEKEEICSSPTWKHTSRKERRATKRLEAERKELEKRLRKLEESQAKLDSGVSDRQSRRLTKKQPLTSGKRSASAESDRPRSSRSLSSFFSSSRRSSRSRASSADGRQSTDDEGASSKGPPTLPLALPEKFGTAVSRELASRHGTSLLSSHQVSRSSHLLHHAAAKSDDLRENWKMAEAWQRQDHEAGRDALASSSRFAGPSSQSLGTRPAPSSKSQSGTTHSPTTNIWAELDRERFTATLRQEFKPGESQKREIPPSLRPASQQGSNASLPAAARSAHNLPGRGPQNAGHGKDKRPSQAKVYSYIPLGRDGKPVTPIIRKEASESSLKPQSLPSSPPQQKGYKSSPLAMNPVTSNDMYQGEDVRHPLKTPLRQKSSRELVPRPLRISSEASRGHGRPGSNPTSSNMHGDRSPPFSGSDRRATLQGPAPSPGSGEPSQAHSNDHRQRQSSRLDAVGTGRPAMSQSTPTSPIQVPLKHPGRKYALSENSPYGRLSLDSKRSAVAFPENERETCSDDQMPHMRHSLAEMPASQSTPNVASHRRFSRSSSDGSSYDTADEEVLGPAETEQQSESNDNLYREADTDANIKIHPSASASTSPIIASKNPTLDTPDPNPTSSVPPLSRNGIITKLRRTSFTQPPTKPTPLHKDQLIAKIFVICCGCHHWHDLPAELYAQFACPERFRLLTSPPPDSQSRLLQRRISQRDSPRRRTSGKRNSVWKSLTLNDGAAAKGRTEKRDERKGFVLDKPKQDVGANASVEAKPESGSESTTTDPDTFPCCWCGHDLKKTCCQGWTTVVQMQQRHH